MRAQPADHAAPLAGRPAPRRLPRPTGSHPGACPSVEADPRLEATPDLGLSKRVVADALWVLRRILAFARANGLFPPGFDPTEGLEAPLPDAAAARSRKPTSQPRPLTLAECAGIASHLHAVHQLAFWLQRIMGLRISEAFGLLVGDVVDLGDTGMLAVQGQGGRTFHVRDDPGPSSPSPAKATAKTAAGSRVLVVPPKMMELLRCGHRGVPHRPRHRRDRPDRPARPRHP